MLAPESLSAQSMSYVLIAIPVFLLLWFVLTYNGLIAKRNQMANAFSSIDVNLKKRHDLIPNVVGAVKGFMNHERELLEKVTQLREQARAASKMSPQRFDLEKQITGCLGEINMRAEAYPDLKSGENFLQLQRLLAEIEEQISAARRAYNSAVMEINNGIEMFPSSIVAGMMKMERGESFEAVAAERGNVSVKLNP